MSFTRIHGHERTAVRFHGSLDVLTAPEVQGLIRELAIEKPRHVLIDLGDLGLIDGAGVAALVSVFRHLMDAGAEVHAECTAGQPLEIFKLTGLCSYFGIAGAEAAEAHP